ncbi:reticulon-like protein B9 isoform X1 [Brachypodium distachyon]|uniref:reticulon-like protein B9 isoform X1 n=1 Tax=Brachypodium distachyon TaxID=15368 RepID=UPI000D0CA1AA|nr:reticulon-like protein B9 isoform X1 [Brachypodium distachyon]|eukprot:XP_003569595.2 reticulon-like protein B9 isoform X1 [Brachypodium distachyon]
MPPHFPSDSNHGRHAVRPLGRHKSIHRLLGGGEAADILLWKNRNLSAGVLAGATLIWFLFDVVEYNIIPLLSQIAIFVMLVIFIWSNAAPIFDRAPPRIPEVVISEHAFRELVLTSHHKLSYAVSLLYDIACGKDLKKLLLVIASLLALSVIGDSCSLTSLLYLGFLCAHTLPALYQRYETEVDHLLARGGEYIKKFYEKIDSNVVSKIPRGPVTGVAFKGSDSIQ